MSKKLSNIIQKVFISSLGGIATAHGYDNVIDESSYSDDLKNRINHIHNLAPSKEDRSKKLLLKLNKLNQFEFLSHRSHRSHSSHRSHYSSTSSGSRTNRSSPSSPSSSSSGSASSLSSGTFVKTPSLIPNYKLGSRILRKGMKGTDVTELINILLKKKYVVLSDGGMVVSGIYTYDEIVEDAVKRFQIENNIDSTGICDVTTVYKLKN
ncbi:peptidoglycan-binding domain-containing protein [Cytophaga sp. FL35]|uniref:peptidoglycan-binding domain-containing protein n=1 Tax=Cytophaga sp. FL35 TaxID=1904456 RepID=UPI001653675F|nr:peptidoglycan-binding domain-containing protein [Cytophaga sp. FL35]MBC7000609.1 hypothetical protein [Cytophaga sp. FL35]